MTAMSLYAIAQEYRALVDYLADSQTDEQAVLDTLEAEAYPLEVKAQNTAYAIKNLEATAEAIKAAEKEMADRRKAIEKRAANLREYTKTCMEIAGVSKIECPHFALTIKKNPSGVEIFEQTLVPAKFLRTPEPPPPSIDKKAVADAIKGGEEVPGAMLTQGTRLDIK